VSAPGRKVVARPGPGCAHFKYMRSSISTQSWASMPPAPALIERIALWPA